jgi:hypothetical protein
MPEKTRVTFHLDVGVAGATVAPRPDRTVAAA